MSIKQLVNKDELSVFHTMCDLNCRIVNFKNIAIDIYNICTELKSNTIFMTNADSDEQALIAEYEKITEPFVTE